MPPILKPDVTNPKTFPNAPSGVTDRTIISLDGIMAPCITPISPIRTNIRNTLTEKAPMDAIIIAVDRKQTAATKLCF
tara:strand:- start:1 stop:234 length:234 start_codon:yes stop_codon:yes gene_type:complete